jgi:hypothetical protein
MFQQRINNNIKDSFYKEFECVPRKFPKYHENFVRRFRDEVEREDIFKPTIVNESLHKISNDNGDRVANVVTSKVKSKMFPHHRFHKYTWTSPDGETHIQIDHILIDRQRHLSVFDV